MTEPSEASVRFWAKVDKAADCWTWTAGKSGGYGRFWLAGRLHQAHRIAYEWSRGPIPQGMVIDHLCRNPSCVNPDHMEPVTGAENIRRGEVGLHMRAKSASITHCPQGHPYDQKNSYRIPSTGARMCRKCSIDRQNARRGKI